MGRHRKHFLGKSLSRYTCSHQWLQLDISDFDDKPRFVKRVRPDWVQQLLTNGGLSWIIGDIKFWRTMVCQANWRCQVKIPAGDNNDPQMVAPWLHLSLPSLHCRLSTNQWTLSPLLPPLKRERNVRRGGGRNLGLNWPNHRNCFVVQWAT